MQSGQWSLEQIKGLLAADLLQNCPDIRQHPTADYASPGLSSDQRRSWGRPVMILFSKQGD
jgi:hypothetical protein